MYTVPGVLPQAITSAAVRLGAHAKYRSAGTVEFLVDDDTGKFYFLEVLSAASMTCARFYCAPAGIHVAICGDRFHIYLSASFYACRTCSKPSVPRRKKFCECCGPLLRPRNAGNGRMPS